MDETETSTAEPPEPSPGAPTAPGVTIDLIDAEGRLNATQRAWVVDHAARAIAPLGRRGEVRVRVVGDEAMAREHATHKGVTGTTDVLTFNLSDDATLDADILVCADEAGRQGERLGHTTERELVLYIVHGVLHCAGHDDADETSAARMHAREDELLVQAGVGATYAPGADRPGREGTS